MGDGGCSSASRSRLNTECCYVVRHSLHGTCGARPMSKSPLHRCTHCKKLVRGSCCRAPARPSQWDHLYRTRAWKHRRLHQLTIEPLCATCGAPAVAADHIEPHRGDPIKFNGPLQSLCTTCHNIKSASERSSS